MSELRKTEGVPIWLPNHADPHLVKRERRAYGADEQAKPLIETGLFETGSGYVYRFSLYERQE